MRYDGPEGEVGFRLVLRLEAPDRYQMTSSHHLSGRRGWQLSVRGDEVLWIDYQEKIHCRLPRDVEILDVLGVSLAGTLGPLRLSRLPPLLLGNLPAEPVGEIEAEDDRWSYVDAWNRKWRVKVREGQPEEWTLWVDGEPVVFWLWHDKWIYLSARRESLQLRWRESVSEPLPGELLEPEVPEDFALAVCESPSDG